MQRFKYDFYGEVVDITAKYIVVMSYNKSYKYLKATIMQKLKARIGQWYYIKEDNKHNIIEMIRVKYER